MQARLELESLLVQSASDMSDIAFITTVSFVVFCLDWSIYSSGYRTIKAFYYIPSKYTFRSSLFPRVFATLLAGAIFSVSMLDDKPDLLPVLLGLVMFGVSIMYALGTLYANSEKYTDGD